MYHPAQSGAMRGPVEIIAEVSPQKVFGQGISHLQQDVRHLLLIQVVKCHQGICLFGHFVIISRFPFGFQQPVHPVYIAKLIAVIIPIKFF